MKRLLLVSMVLLLVVVAVTACAQPTPVTVEVEKVVTEVVEVEGETHKLTGSAEAQYTQWRALLKRIYISETGFTGS